MTGFAQSRVDQDGWSLRVNLRSVNHRFLDLHLRYPEGWEIFEPRIRKLLRERLRRGHVDFTLHFDPSAPAAVQVNQSLAEAYLRTAEDLRGKLGWKTEPDVVQVLRLPGVVCAGGLAGNFSEEEQVQLGERLAACLRQALDHLEEMRCSEGAHLDAEMRGRLAGLRTRVDRIEELAGRCRPAYASRLEARLKELLGPTPLDPARLAQEAALLAERSDICEELARLRSHIEQFQKLLAGGGELGKKLDFLLQEMQREANTMLSKTPGVEAEGLAMTDLALEVKSEIEKLREQVQNVE